MTAFWDGFEKQAALHYYRLPSNHTLYYLTSKRHPTNPGVIATTQPVHEWEQHKIESPVEKVADVGAGTFGFTGAGKGNLGTAEKDRISGTARSAPDTMVDKTLIDRDRGPRTEDPFSTGPEFQDESNPHIRY